MGPTAMPLLLTCSAFHLTLRGCMAGFCRLASCSCHGPKPSSPAAEEVLGCVLGSRTPRPLASLQLSLRLFLLLFLALLGLLATSSVQVLANRLAKRRCVFPCFPSWLGIDQVGPSLGERAGLALMPLSGVSTAKHYPSDVIRSFPSHCFFLSDKIREEGDSETPPSSGNVVVSTSQAQFPSIPFYRPSPNVGCMVRET